MKRILTLAFLVILLIGGCEVIQLIEAPIRTKADSLIVSATDTIWAEDSTKYPIVFEVEVKEWEEVTDNL